MIARPLLLLAAAFALSACSCSAAAASPPHAQQRRWAGPPSPVRRTHLSSSGARCPRPAARPGILRKKETVQAAASGQCELTSPAYDDDDDHDDDDDDDDDGDDDDAPDTASSAAPSPSRAAIGSSDQKTRRTKRRGVNLGGWLVLEQWMVPSVFAKFKTSKVVDEWTLGTYVPHDRAVEILQPHWDSWVQEADFADMKKAGLNFVRIPVGYWLWDKDQANEPYVISNQTAYLRRAVSWAKKYDLEVLITLHGVPGSQNGFDSSGHKQDTFHFQDSPQHAARAVRVVQSIARDSMQDGFKGTVTMIELINEPLCHRSDALLSYTVEYYHSAYQAIRNVAGIDITVVLADGFLPLSRWNRILSNTSWTNVLIDTHVYPEYYNANLGNVPTPFNQKSLAKEMCSLLGLKSKYPVLVGEWTMSMPPCPRCWSFPLPMQNFLKAIFQTQAAVYESFAAGWSLWAYRIEGNRPGSYESGLQSGWIPEKLGDYNRNLC